MSSEQPKIILYAYPQSPFAQKLSLVLLFKALPYSLCPVERMPPRPPLLSLGINYRRIPVLAIGNDVYFDTSLAVRELERRWPDEGVSLLGNNGPLQEGAAFFWADRAIFKIAGCLLPWKSMPKEFVADRESYRGGGKVNPDALEQGRPEFLSALRSHMIIIEQQLSKRTSSGHFFLDTEKLTYIDLALFFTLNWISQFGTATSIFPSASSTTGFPLIGNWLNIIRGLIKQTQESSSHFPPTDIKPDEATKLILSGSSSLSETSPVLASDDQEPLLASSGAGGWLKLGEPVFVTPDDTGVLEKQKGVLRVLNADRVVIEVTPEKAEEGQIVRVHAPRLGYTVKPVGNQ